MPVKQKFYSMEEKLLRITNYFEAKLKEHQHAMMVQEQTIEYLINAVAKLTFVGLLASFVFR